MSFEDFLLEQPKAPPVPNLVPETQIDPFEAFLRKQQVNQKQRTTDNAQATTVINAQQSASTAALSAPVARQIGLPQSAVETDLPKYKAQAKAEKNAAIISDSPLVAKWVAANPDSARIAQDEYDKLAMIEKSWEVTKGIGAGTIKALGGSFSQSALALNRAIGSVIPGDWWQRHMVAPLQEDQEVFKPQGTAENIGGMVGGLGGVMSQVVLTGGAGAEIPVTAGALTTVAQAARNAVQQMWLPATSAAINTGADVLKATGDPATAYKAAAAAYSGNVAMGMVPLSVPGSLPSRLLTGATSNAVQSEANRAAMNLVLPQEMQRPFNLDELISNTLQGAVMGGVLGPRLESNFREAIRQTYIDASKAEQATRDIGKVAALGEIAQGSKLREADPQAFKTFVETVTDKSNLDAVYVDSKILSEALLQSKVNINDMPEVAKQLADASLTKGDVRISVSDYATHIAGTDLEKPLLQNMKPSPYGMTFAEGQKFYEQAAQEMEKRAQEVVKKQQQDIELQQDKEAVFQKTYDQLTSVGRSPSVAKTEATLHQAFYSTMAERLGMKPSEFAAKYPVQIKAETPAGMRLEQPAYHGSPHEFDAFSLDHIGSGEGAQAFGWGLYFAENRDVAAGYFRSLADQPGIKEMKLGSLRMNERNSFDYTRRASESSVENVRASLAEDLLINENTLHAVGKGGFAEHVLKTLDDRIANYYDPAVDQKMIDAAKTLRRMLSHEGSLSIDFHPVKGGVYSVEIPDEATGRMLLWDKPFAEQPKAVKDALRASGDYKAYRENLSDFSSPMDTRGSVPRGERIYAFLVHKYGSNEAASRHLAEIGIPGLRYLDQGSRDTGKGSHNVVLWDQKVIDQMNQQVNRALYQNNRGAFSPETHTIALLKNADLSTFVHESGHFFLDTMAKIDSPEIKSDLNTLLKWAGADPAKWSSMSLEEQRPYHEKVAQGLEQYLFEGKAPTAELQPIFSRIRSWMVNIYKSLRALGEPLTPEVRQVFDRLLASDSAIKEAEAQRAYQIPFKTAEEAGMTPAAFQAWKDMGTKATDQAIGEMQAKSLKDMQWVSGAKGRALRELQVQGAKARKGIEAEVTKEVDQLPVYQALDYIKAKSPEYKQQLDEWQANKAAIISQSKETMDQAKDTASKMIKDWETANPEPPKPTEFDPTAYRKRGAALKLLARCMNG